MYTCVYFLMKNKKPCLSYEKYMFSGIKYIKNIFQYDLTINRHLDIVEVISSSQIIPKCFKFFVKLILRFFYFDFLYYHDQMRMDRRLMGLV